MRAKRAATLLGGAALLLAMPGVAHAQATVQPAPDGEASAVAARVGEVVAVSDTHARATTEASSSEATANVLEVGGTPPLAQLGGTQRGVGTTEGALLDTGENANIRVAVAPHRATVGESGGVRTSSSQAALVRLILTPVLRVDLLQSESHATHENAVSRATTSSDTAVIELAGIRLVLLHAEAASEGRGQTYLVGLNDTKIGTNDQLGNVSTLDIPGILTLNLLRVSGGPGNVVATVTDALPVNTEALRAQLQAVTAAGNTASPAVPVGRELGGASGAGGGGGGGLATTGRHVSLAVLGALGLLALGGALVAGTRRRPALAA